MTHPKEFAEGLSIGIIMDGNGRWAKNRGLPRTLFVLLRAELGFFGVAVLTAVHTPLFCGEEVFVLFFLKEL